MKKSPFTIAIAAGAALLALALCPAAVARPGFHGGGHHGGGFFGGWGGGWGFGGWGAGPFWGYPIYAAPLSMTPDYDDDGGCVLRRRQVRTPSGWRWRTFRVCY
jgi:hypothetical protein